MAPRPIDKRKAGSQFFSDSRISFMQKHYSLQLENQLRRYYADECIVPNSSKL